MERKSRIVDTETYIFLLLLLDAFGYSTAFVYEYCVQKV